VNTFSHNNTLKLHNYNSQRTPLSRYCTFIHVLDMWKFENKLVSNVQFETRSSAVIKRPLWCYVSVKKLVNCCINSANAIAYQPEEHFLKQTFFRLPAQFCTRNMAKCLTIAQRGSDVLRHRGIHVSLTARLKVHSVHTAASEVN